MKKRTFAGIVEGVTDKRVITNILAGYFNNPDIKVTWLQPRDTIPNTKEPPAGWTRVLKYCKTKQFKDSFQENEYVIIHIDTDVSPKETFDIAHHDENGSLLTPEQLIAKVVNKFRLLIGEDFYDQYEDKIIFAIAVHSIECWLLPLFLPEKKAEIDDCMNILKRDLPNFKPKDHKYYQRISIEYANTNLLLKLYPENPSLKIFIEQLASRNIEISEES
ncbi:phage tail protein [Pseudanabaena galeata UHCC 0370]|uniref:Phage tail protein n=1 Tax=Pseudanabaena galeata UHCC 0370 TaxID=3110310 RepID=A0ABU5TJ98_9CYAN|nr:phage tail protein [Pseudanabaena galeata]MEA5478325.1 phage tail protein [Pseudanabaena galeata UHCC 0370]